MSYPRLWLVVPAAGIGQRMQADCPKQYLRIHGRFVLDITLSRLLNTSDFSGCTVALNASDPWWPDTDASKNPAVSYCVGGVARADSVLAALRALAKHAQPEDWVLVHDVARPCVDPLDIARLVDTLRDHPVGGLLAAPITDTVKRVAPGENEVVATVDRQHLWRALTPQMFRFSRLKQALEQALAEGVTVTDEASAIEHIGLKPIVVSGRPDNIKITLPADLALAEFILGQFEAGSDSELSGNQGMRIGQGFDVHAFCEGGHIILGGVTIPHKQGLKAHSDGDVLLHALADALLGAVALGDIGHLFPDTSAVWEGADSRHLLREVVARVKREGYEVVNIDTVIMAQSPKMAPHVMAMRTNIAEDLVVPVACVSVKATTTEKLGFTGRNEGIACQAICLLKAVTS